MPAYTAAMPDDFTVEQGTTFTRSWTWWTSSAENVAKDLAGFTARMQIRSTVASDIIILSLTNTAGITVLNGAVPNNIALTLTDTQTAAFAFTTAVYDLELVSGTGVVTRLVKGTITLDKEVTR